MALFSQVTVQGYKKLEDAELWLFRLTFTSVIKGVVDVCKRWRQIFFACKNLDFRQVEWIFWCPYSSCLPIAVTRSVHMVKNRDGHDIEKREEWTFIDFWHHHNLHRLFVFHSFMDSFNRGSAPSRNPGLLLMLRHKPSIPAERSKRYVGVDAKYASAGISLVVLTTKEGIKFLS